MALKRTVCTSRKRVHYYWRDNVDGGHVEATVEKLLEAVELPHRRTNAYLEEDNRAMFEERLKMAREGKLVPGDHVKTILHDPALDVFEIRWQEVAVIPVDPVSGLLQDRMDVPVRLYYIETGQPWIVGLYVHEKEVVPGDEKATWDKQEQHIARACHYGRERAADCWGVAELGDRCG